jgi:hypothetical protein
MFVRSAPQQARHSDGYIIQVGDRYSVQYVHGAITAEMAVDFAARTGIFPETLAVRNLDGGLVASTQKQREAIIARIKSGLNFLGIQYEVRKGRFWM